MTAQRLTAAIVLLVLLLSTLPGRAVTPAEQAQAAWAAPPTMTLKHISSMTGQQHEPAYLSNLDCELEEYRTPSDTTTRTGCFTETAFGQMDADSNMVIFNGSDEAVQLLPPAAGQILAPWPRALNLTMLDAVPTGGSSVSLYKNPLTGLKDSHNLALQLVSKQITIPADIVLKDAAGHPLVINAQSLAYADSGSWIVVEVLAGSFVRINLATLDMKPFAPVYARQGSPGLDESSVTITPDGQYVAVENTYASEFKVYDLSQCNGNICASYNYWPFIKNQIDSLMYISHVRFVNDGILSFDATTKNSDSGGNYELAPVSGIHSLIDYLGLGDSYSSGQGAFDYLAGTDSADNRCHLSSHSYPLLLARDLYTSAGAHSIACSGAVLHDVGDISNTYRGQVRGVVNWNELTANQPALLASIMTNYLPGYVAQQRFVSQYQPSIITLGIGGNNVGFGNILERCIEPHTNLHLVSNTCFATYEDRQELLTLVKKTGTGLRKLYQQLLKQDPGVTLYVIGYPQISVDNGSCALNVHFNTSELEFADELVDQINGAISAAASAAGAQYVDITQALAGHRLCETSSFNIAVNGLTAGNDSGLGDFNFLGSESYHPNALGQQLIEQAILRQTNNLKRGSTSPARTDTSAAFLTAPKSNRPVNQLLSAHSVTAGQVKGGQKTTILLNPLSYGLTADSYSVHLDGAQGVVIGSITNGSGDYVVPDGTIAGVHTIDIIGSNQTGEPVDISQPVVVNSVAGPCAPLAASGQDSDADGIDDACDPFIDVSTTTQQTLPTAASGKGSAPLDATTDPLPPIQTASTTSVIQIATQFTHPQVAVRQGRVLGAWLTAPSQPVVNPQLRLQKKYQAAVPRQWPLLNQLPWLWWLVALAVTLIAGWMLDRWLRERLQQ